MSEEVVEISKKANMTAEERRAGAEVADFILSVANMVDREKISKRKHRIGKLSANNARIIENLMKSVDQNFSIEGYELWIDGTGADHIEVRHGANGKADRSMASREAKEIIPWAANTADGGELVLDSRGNLALSDRYKNFDNTPSVQIRLYKKIDGDTFYVSECVPDNAKKYLHYQRIRKKR